MARFGDSAEAQWFSLICTGYMKMKCPYCNEEMIHGYLNCSMAIWSERKHRVSLLPDSKEKYALHLGYPVFSPHHVESHCCPNCKKLIIDVADTEHNL